MDALRKLKSPDAAPRDWTTTGPSHPSEGHPGLGGRRNARVRETRITVGKLDESPTSCLVREIAMWCKGLEAGSNWRTTEFGTESATLTKQQFQ